MFKSHHLGIETTQFHYCVFYSFGLNRTIEEWKHQCKMLLHEHNSSLNRTIQELIPSPKLTTSPQNIPPGCPYLLQQISGSRSGPVATNEKNKYLLTIDINTFLFRLKHTPPQQQFNI